MADCATMLHNLGIVAEQAHKLLSSESVVAACVQAAEAEHAGRLQANAAWHAGMVTFIATAGAVGAALWAAYRQSRVEHRREKELGRYYLRHLNADLIAVTEETIWRMKVLDGFNCKNIKTLDMTETVPALDALINKLAPSNWQELYRIGPRLEYLDQTLNSLKRYRNERVSFRHLIGSGALSKDETNQDYLRALGNLKAKALEATDAMICLQEELNPLRVSWWRHMFNRQLSSSTTPRGI